MVRDSWHGQEGHTSIAITDTTFSREDPAEQTLLSNNSRPFIPARFTTHERPKEIVTFQNINVENVRVLNSQVSSKRSNSSRVLFPTPGPDNSKEMVGTLVSSTRTLLLNLATLRWREETLDVAPCEPPPNVENHTYWLRTHFGLTCVTNSFETYDRSDPLSTRRVASTGPFFYQKPSRELWAKVRHFNINSNTCIWNILDATAT